ncbi:uncharacterized protein KGF55_004519 [Candida pseudojiufengensis]|uniref:uncharacterized protein n=1 Tax=Candida pseudojiufengensis TaxID=497109 RepID=UPI002225AF31|nr:uncharacterized protein KGF55_004519 [Candida pseudojiufengensis]KAI5960626.1 hypothetical protein KGF55_004519 [Candida pseudojiufengensis]
MSESNPLKTIDISQPINITSKELLASLTTQGFVFIEGHDFTQNEVDKLFDISKEFFNLPASYKDQFPKDQSNSGYIQFNRENLDPSQKDDMKEGMNFCGLNLATGESSGPIPDWFKNNSERDELIKNSIIKLNQLAIQLLKILATGLGINDDDQVKGLEWFSSRYVPNAKSGSTLRFLHYPALTSPDASPIRAGAHTDYGSMTLLFQRKNQEGLEIYSMNKKWEKVPFISGSKSGMAPPIIVNVGDLMSYWTSGYLKSTIHRVKFTNDSKREDRYSIVFFSHPSHDTLLEPVPSDLLKDRMGRGVSKDVNYITANQHTQAKLAKTYGY